MFTKMGVKKEDILKKMAKDGSWSDTVVTYYKGGNYATVMQGILTNRTIYHSKENKIYILKEGSNDCPVTDAGKDTEHELGGSLPTVKQIDSTATIQGVKCNIVRVQWKSGTYDYYYNSQQLNVNPELFSKHVYDGWSEFLKISKALPLQIVREAPGMMTVISTIIMSTPGTVPSLTFEVPPLVADESLNIIKMPISEIMRIERAPSSPAESLFKKYLESDEDEDMKKVIDSNDGVYSLYCKAFTINDPDEKISLYTEFLGKNPNLGVASAYLLRGISNIIKGNLEATVFDCTKSLALESRDMYAYYFKARACYGLGKIEEAIEGSTQAIKLQKDYTDAYLLRGICYNDTEKYPEALADLNKAIDLQKDNAEAFEYRGYVHYEMAEYKQAIADWKEAQKLTKTDKEAIQTMIEKAQTKMKEKK